MILMQISEGYRLSIYIFGLFLCVVLGGLLTKDKK
jgi:hypothetical protein